MNDVERLLVRMGTLIRIRERTIEEYGLEMAADVVDDINGMLDDDTARLARLVRDGVIA